jgi:hypothetical protein
MEKVLVLESKYLDTLGSLRGIAGLKAASDGELIWLRGILASSTPDKRVSSLPILHSYGLDESERLFPTGKKTPTGKLPKLDWKLIKSFLPIELPVSALPGKVFLHLDVCLSRATEIKEAFALMTDLDSWKSYAETAPITRLEQLRFAVSNESQVLVIGYPLPQLPGQTYWPQENRLLPSGYDFEPPVLASLLKDQLRLDQESLLLFEPDGHWQSIPLPAFQPARRSAVRLTKIHRG